MRPVRAVLLVASGCILAGSVSVAALAAPSANDQAIARAGVLTLEDFPPGWAPTPSLPSNRSLEQRLIRTIPACKPLRPLIGLANTNARAQPHSDFTDGALTISNAVSVFPDVTRAETSFTAAKTTSLSQCLERAFGQLIHSAATQHGVSLRNVSVIVEPANPPIHSGDDQGAVSATITATANGTPGTGYNEYVFIRVGRAIDSFTYQTDNAPTSDYMLTVVDASVARLQAALG
jgi:hypothetical protein